MGTPAISGQQRRQRDGSAPWISAHRPESDALHDLTEETIAAPAAANVQPLSIEARVKNYQTGVSAALAKIDRADVMQIRNILIAAGTLLAASVGGCFAGGTLQSTAASIAGFVGICGAVGLAFAGACNTNHKQPHEDALLRFIENFRALQSDLPGRLLQVSGMSYGEMAVLVEAMQTPIRRGDNSAVKLSTDGAVEMLQDIGQFMLEHRQELETMGTQVPPAQWLAIQFRDLAKTQQMSKDTASAAGKAYRYFRDYKESSN